MIKPDEEGKMIYHCTVITHSVEEEGHSGLGHHAATAAMIDKQIDRAVQILMGRHFMRMDLVSVTYCPVRYGASTSLVLTVLARKSDDQPTQEEVLSGLVGLVGAVHDVLDGED